MNRSPRLPAGHQDGISVSVTVQVSDRSLTRLVQGLLAVLSALLGVATTTQLPM